MAKYFLGPTTIYQHSCAPPPNFVALDPLLVDNDDPLNTEGSCLKMQGRLSKCLAPLITCFGLLCELYLMLRFNGISDKSAQHQFWHQAVSHSCSHLSYARSFKNRDSYKGKLLYSTLWQYIHLILSVCLLPFDIIEYYI